MDQQPTFVAILSGEGEEKEAIAKEIHAYGAEYEFASTASGLRNVVCTRPSNGVLFCIASLVCLDTSEKEITQSLERLYPAARIRWNKKNSAFNIMASCAGLIRTLPDFLKICSDFNAKRMRRNERFRKSLNALLSASSDLSNAERTFTVDISRDGCFVHTKNSWNIGDPAYVSLQELSNKAPIEVRIRRQVPWGTPFHAEGIGLEFINLDPAILRELEWLLYG